MEGQDGMNPFVAGGWQDGSAAFEII